MKRLDDERFIVERDDSVVVTLRIKSSVLDKYEKLTALVKTIDPCLNGVTRSRVMRLVLERAVNQLLRDPRVLLVLLRNE
jgi:hypothetical protein